MRIADRFLASTILAGMAFSLMAPSALAADSAGTGEGRDDEIIVNGLPVEEGQNRVAANGAMGSKPLLDTPFSITVVDKDDIAKRQANNIAQIFINDPSVFSFATAGTVNWWGTQIRGLGVRNYYIDDVPLILYWGGDFPLESVETVEALKGLTGFMYGFGAPGGVISYRTKRPTAEPTLSTELGYRTITDFYAHIDAGGPLTQDGNLSYRINVAREKGKLYNDAKTNRWLASLALEYQITPDLNWYATGTFEDNKLRDEPFQLYWSEYRDTVLPSVTYDYKKLNIDNSYYHATTLATATGLDWHFATGWSAKATYGFTSKKHRSNKMFAYMQDRTGDYTGYLYNFGELDRSEFAQLMVQGDFTTGPIRHELVAGASLQINDSEFGRTGWGRTDPGFEGDPNFIGNIYQTPTYQAPSNPVITTQGGPGRERQRALFLSDTLHLGEQVQVMLGGRYTRYTLVDVDGDPTSDTRYSTSKLTPTIALIYKPAPYASLYASYVEALEPGSRVGAQYVNRGAVLKPTMSRQYEVGAKIEHSGFSLTAAGFRIERGNTLEVGTAPNLTLTQDGLAIYQGVELIGRYRVSDAFRFGLGAVHLDATIQDVADLSLVGKTPKETAKWQVVGNAEYSVAPGLTLHGNVRYFDKAPTDDANTLYIPSRTLANVGFQYQTEIRDRKVTFTGNVNNVLNTKYWGLQNFGEARNASLSARIAW